MRAVKSSECGIERASQWVGKSSSFCLAMALEEDNNINKNLEEPEQWRMREGKDVGKGRG